MGEQVSVIVTVRNEGEHIRRLLESLALQSRRPDEVVICDGGSTDDTLDVLEGHVGEGSLPLRVILQPGANISQGRNAAIAEAGGPLIAVTDAGVRLEPDWLATLIAPLEDNRSVQAVSGFFAPDPHTPFEVALGATTLPARTDVDPARFLPSSRSVAFRKAAWSAVSGYPEWIDYCEDLLFDLALRERVGPFVFVPQALVHFRPRPHLTAFLRQYYRYARGDGKADLWPRRHAVRYGTYLVAVPGLLLLGLWQTPWWLMGYLLGGALMFYAPYRRLRAFLPPLAFCERCQAIAWVPIIRIAGDMAKMAGYPVGRWWRRRHRRQIPARYPH